MGPIPALGEHTENLLAELGFTPDEVGTLLSTQVARAGDGARER